MQKDAMNEMVLIDDDLLDRTSEKALRAPRLRMNHNFHTREDEPVNRLLNAMEPGTYLPVHRHTAPPKSESDRRAQRAPRRVRFRRPGTNRATGGRRSVARRVWVRHRSGRMARVARARAGNGRFRGQAGPYVPVGAVDLAPWTPAADDAEAVGRFLAWLREQVSPSE